MTSEAVAGQSGGETRPPHKSKSTCWICSLRVWPTLFLSNKLPAAAHKGRECLHRRRNALTFAAPSDGAACCRQTIGRVTQIHSSMEDLAEAEAEAEATAQAGEIFRLLFTSASQ